MYGDERASAVMCLVAQSGVRLEVLGNAQGNDGLRVGDLPELKIHLDHVEFTKIPALVSVRPSLSKTNHRYLTFLPKEACDHLMAYLNNRLSEGEKLNPDAPMIAKKSGFKGN